MIRNLQFLSGAHALETPGDRASASTSRLAALLALGVIFAFCVIPFAGLAASSNRGLSLGCVLGNALLLFPLALIAVRVGLLASRNLRIPEQSMPGLLTRTVLVASLFALFLFCVSGPRQTLERAFGASPTHVFHGQPREARNRAETIVSSGIRDASLGYLAALPLTFLGLVLLFRRGCDGPPIAKVSHDQRRVHRPRMGVVSTTIALAAVVAGAAGSIINLTEGTHLDAQGALELTHPVTRISVNDGFSVEDLHVTVQSAQRLRQPQLAETAAAAGTATATGNDADRIYLEVTFENAGDRLRGVGRGVFRVVARDGAGWGPLADDFPEILLGPRETLTTRLIFEVPPQATQLAFMSTAGPAEKRIPIGDDSIGALLGTLCRALVKTWGT